MALDPRYPNGAMSRRGEINAARRLALSMLDVLAADARVYGSVKAEIVIVARENGPPSIDIRRLDRPARIQLSGTPWVDRPLT